MPINKALAEYLELYHKGEANAVTSRELECAFRMRGSELRREINALRGDGIPICSFDGGYYYAATEEELRRTIRQLRMSVVERGVKAPKLDKLVAIANVLKVGTDELLQDNLDAATLLHATEISERLKALSPEGQRKVMNVLDTLINELR